MSPLPADRASCFRIATERDAGPETVVIRCAGEVDLSTADQFRAALRMAVSPGLGVLRVDMSEVTFLDSSCLGCLAYVIGLCNEAHARLELIPSPHVRRLVELTQLPLALPRRSTVGE